MAGDHLNHIALVIMYLGLFGWIISAVMFIIRGFTTDGRIRFRKALPWFVSIFACLAVWIVGMLFLGYRP